MATRTGTAIHFALAGQNPAAQNVSIPSDAELVVVFWSGWASGGFARSGSITLDGVALTVGFEVGATGDAAGTGVAYRTISAPERGTTKALDWAWTANPAQGPCVSVVFFTGVDTASPVRDADGLAWENPGPVVVTTNTVNVDTNTTDYVIGYTSSYSGSGGDGLPPDGAPTSSGQTTDDDNIATNAGYQADISHENTPGATTTAFSGAGYYGALAVLVVKNTSGAPALNEVPENPRPARRRRDRRSAFPDSVTLPPPSVAALPPLPLEADGILVVRGGVFIFDDAAPPALAPSTTVTPVPEVLLPRRRTPRRRLGPQDLRISSPAITGVLAETSPVRTDSSSGTVQVSGTLTETSSVRTDALSGTVAVAGTLSETSSHRTDSLSGAVQVAGTISETSTVRVDSLSGAVVVAGSISETSSHRTDSLTGTVQVSGTVSETSTHRTDTASGTVQVLGSAADTSPARADALSGSVAVTGTLAETSSHRTDSASGAAQVAGTLSETSTVRVDGATGAVGSNLLIETSPVRTDSATGSVQVAGTLAETSTVRTDSTSGTVQVSGSVSETSSHRTDSSTGVVQVSGALSETSSVRTDSLTGTVAGAALPPPLETRPTTFFRTFSTPQVREMVPAVLASPNVAKSPLDDDPISVSRTRPVFAFDDEEVLAPAAAPTFSVLNEFRTMWRAVRRRLFAQADPVVLPVLVGITGSINETSPARTDALSGNTTSPGSVNEVSPARFDTATGAVQVTGTLLEFSHERLDTATGSSFVSGVLAETSSRRVDVVSEETISGTIDEVRAPSQDQILGEIIPPFVPTKKPSIFRLLLSIRRR